MSNLLMMDRIGMLIVAVCVFVGCDSSTIPLDQPNDSEEQSAGPREVTFYLKGMNKQLKIL